MNKFTSISISRKGVSPWVAALVMAVIMALIVAVLPTTATSARADESEVTVANDFTISEITDDAVALIDSNDLGEDAPAPGIADVIEDPAAEPAVDGVEVAPDTDPELGLLDGLVNALQNNNLINPLQAQRDPGPVNVDIEYTEIVSIPANQDGNVYVGDRVRISGTWNGQLTAGGTAQTFIDGDTFSIPFPEQITVISQNIRLTDATDPLASWGTCTPNLATNSYDCLVVGAELPQNQDQPFGDFSATASASAEGTFGNGLVVLPRQQGDLNLSKSVEHILDGPLLGNEPSGTVFSYLVQVSGSALQGRSEPLVLVDTFDDNLTFNDAFGVTAVDSFGAMPVSHVFDSATNTLVVTLAPEVAFAGDTVNVRYRLVTDSGGLDPVGTEYVNTVAAEVNNERVTADARITQVYENTGSGQGVTRGSFDLTKIVDEVPAGFDPTNYPFSIQVDEYAPGNFPGPVESTYNLEIVDGQVVTGLNARPAGWTIVLSENLDRSVYNWDEPVFSGNGVTTFVENGKTFARFETISATNVGISLTNRVSAPEIGTTAQVEGSSDNVLSLAGGTVVDTVAYQNLKPNTAYTLDGEIVAVDAAGAVTETGITASGEFTTPGAPAGQSFVSGSTEVTFTITGAEAVAWANQTLVVYERLFEVGVPDVIATHEDPTDPSQTFWVAPGEPNIGTLAQVQNGNNPKLLPLTGGEVVDTVSYQFLEPETEYRLEGELMHVDGANVTATGIVSSGTFTTPAAPAGQLYVSGTAAVTFTISAAQAERYGGQNLVVYEELYDVTTNDLVTDHKDPTDAGQTFRVEQRGVDLGTSAATNGPTTKLLPLTGGQVVDTVSYTNLDPETEYRLEGELMHVDAAFNATPTGIIASAVFTTPAAAQGEFHVSGTALVVFDITAAQAELYGGQSLVVYEELYDVTTNDLVAEHKDPRDPLQTFEIERPEVEIGTQATVTADPTDNILPITGGEVIDTVSYTNLDPETEYRLDGELMHVAADGTVTATGILGSTTFTTPAAAAGEYYVSGTIDVVFTITGDQAYQYGGETLVVFEDLFLVATNELIADHRDPADQDQTFFIEQREPEIGTLAQVQGADPKLLPITGGEVVDTVSYTDLQPETEYRLDGELMHVAADGTVTATGILGTTTFTTPAAAAGEYYVSGTVDVTFTISAAAAVEYAGEKLVVYEQLFQPSGPTPDVPVAVHEDPDDEDQSFDIEPGGTIVVGKKVTGPKGDQVERDESSVFQVRAEWIDSLGNEQSRTFNVTPGEPVSLEGLPLNTEITLTEIGADTDVSNVKWGDIIWSGTGVVDQPGNSPDGIIILEDPNATVQVGLENKTSSNGLIIIPIPIPLPPAGGIPTPPPAPVAPVTPPIPPEVSPVSPKDGIQPSAKDGIQPQGAAPQRGAAPQAQQTGLAATGADVVLLAGGGIAILILGAWLVLRGRRNES